MKLRGLIFSALSAALLALLPHLAFAADAACQSRSEAGSKLVSLRTGSPMSPIATLTKNDVTWSFAVADCVAQLEWKLACFPHLKDDRQLLKRLKGLTASSKPAELYSISPRPDSADYLAMALIFAGKASAVSSHTAEPIDKVLADVTVTEITGARRVSLEDGTPLLYVADWIR